MGEAELDKQHKQIIIHSDIITYGDAADPAITESIREEIETMWNEPAAIVLLKGKDSVLFLGSWVLFNQASHQNRFLPM